MKMREIIDIVMEGFDRPYRLYKNPDRHRFAELVREMNAQRPALLVQLAQHNPDEITLDEDNMLMRGSVDNRGNIYVANALLTVHSMMEDDLDHEIQDDFWVDTDGVVHGGTSKALARWKKRIGQ